MSLSCLVVDDSENFLTAASTMLERSGITVVATAVNGVDALRLAEERRPDVVLLDVCLADEEDGFEVARQLDEKTRGNPGDDRHTSIILISTHDEDEFENLVKESPAIGYLGKHELSVRRIRELLQNRAV